MRRFLTNTPIFVLAFALTVYMAASGSATVAQETESADPSEATDTDPVSTAVETDTESAGESGKLVLFERDIAPILRSRCLECHGPEDAKQDFRVDDPEVFLAYVEPGDADSSALYIDHLTTDDEDLQMPPKAKGGPLSPAELALIRVWIEEGASWSEGFQWSDAETVAPEPQPEVPQSFSERAWVAIGYLHPATVHFPIALFVLGAAFVVLGWKWPSVGTQIPLACMLIGTASAIAVVAMGWSLAPTKGYGTAWELLDFERDVDAHRWSAVIVTLLASVSSLIALVAYWTDNDRLHQIWRIGLLLCGLGIGLVGHKGGEMTYGRDFFPEMFRTLLGETQDAVDSAAPREGVSKAGRPIPSTDRLPTDLAIDQAHWISVNRRELPARSSTRCMTIQAKVDCSGLDGSGSDLPSASA